MGPIELWIHQKAKHAHKHVMEHPVSKDIGKAVKGELSPIERLCQSVANWTGLPYVLIASIVFQVAWVIFGQITKMDPFPFVFLLTCSNIVQLELLFIVNVAQRQSNRLAERQSTQDHETISRILHHHEVQESILLRLAKAQAVDISDLLPTIAKLAMPTEQVQGEL